MMLYRAKDGYDISGAGDERDEGPDDRHEPAEDNRFPAVPLEELVRPIDISRVDPAPPLRVVARLVDDARTSRPPDRVVHRVTGDRRHQQQNRGEADVQRPDRRDRSGGKQERIARQERRHHQPRRGEGDGKEQGIDPRTVGRDNVEKIAGGVEKQVDQMRHEGLG